MCALVRIQAIVLHARVRGRQLVVGVHVQVVVQLPVRLTDAASGVEQALQHVLQDLVRAQGDADSLNGL